MRLLSHDLVRGSAATTHWTVFVHGILGTKANLRSLARRMTQGHPHWGALLVDLREHGDSQGMPPPHTVDAAAADLEALRRALGIVPSVLLGHSFGGKVVLRDLALHGALEVTPEVGRLVWPARGRVLVLDANPGTPPEDGSLSSTWQVLALLETLPSQWPSRDTFADALKAQGLSDVMTGWLAMNLRPTGETFQWGLSPAHIRELLADYLRTDAWETVLDAPRDWGVDLIIGGRSGNFRDEDMARIDTACAAGHRLHATRIADAGHWVHIEAPAIVQARLHAAIEAVED